MKDSSTSLISDIVYIQLSKRVSKKQTLPQKGNSDNQNEQNNNKQSPHRFALAPLPPSTCLAFFQSDLKRRPIFGNSFIVGQVGI